MTDKWRTKLSCQMIFVLLGALCSFLVSGPSAAGTLEQIKERGAIRIGYRLDAPPHSYARRNGEPAGFVVEICRDVAASIQKSIAPAPLKVQYVPVTSKDRFEAVRTGKVDLLCEASSITMSRREIVDFSLATFVDGAAVLTARGNTVQTFEDLAGKRVGVLAGTTTERVLTDSLAALGVEAAVTKVKTHRDASLPSRVGSWMLISGIDR